nr:MAG TPA: hypothetical protein [Caudoviricetes sp.]
MAQIPFNQPFILRLITILLCSSLLPLSYRDSFIF